MEKNALTPKDPQTDRATFVFPRQNFSINLNSVSKNLSLTMTHKEICSKKSHIKRSKIMEKLAETERKFERNERMKNMIAVKSMNAKIQDKYLVAKQTSLSRKLKINYNDIINDHGDQTDRKHVSSSPRNRLSLNSTCDYHILNYFRTLKRNEQKSDCYSSVTRENINKYLRFFDAFNKIDRKINYPEKQNAKSQEIKSYRLQDEKPQSEYIRDLKEKDLMGFSNKK